MRTYTEMDFHRIAALFPLIEGEDLDEMADDIAARGLHHAITLYEGQILDGRNRYRACLLRGIEPRYQQFDPAWGSPTAWVISENAKRRHLTAGQLAAIGREAEKFFETEARERQRLGQERGREVMRARREGDMDQLVHIEKGGRGGSRALAARSVGVSETQLQRAGTLQKHAPDLFDQVKAGARSLNSAMSEADARGVVPRKPRSQKSGPVRLQRPTPAAVVVQVKDLSSSARRVVEQFDAGLAIDLTLKHPGLILPEWEEVCAMLRGRLIRLLGPYSLAARKSVPGTAESGLQEEEIRNDCDVGGSANGRSGA